MVETPLSKDLVTP